MAHSPDLRGLIDNADDAADLVSVFANRQRLLTLRKLARRERCVGTRTKELGISQPGISTHINALKAKKLITARCEGATVFYSLWSPRVKRILASLAGIYRR